MAGVSTPDREPCHYGVSRHLCRVGCGYQCMPARRAKSDAASFTASPSVAAEHDKCNTSECCRNCW